ncbi:hypothetical protein J1605_005133 [Eschrichtius robustus]|uniref:Uncharacterized protein n=1 Tax=Eschrichtius robustus TaxID=9764 RepID=A0AB34H7Y7_ESCRO|nr:hypothetical protein J1605_005133 [Eschrichtius robustus]
MGGPAPLARPGGLSAAEERPRPRDCGRPTRLTPPPPWRAPRSRLRYPVGPAPRRRPQAVPVQGARPLGMRGRGDAGTRGRGDSGTRGGRGRRECGRPWAVGTLAAGRSSARPGRGRPRGRWARPRPPPGPALRALRAPPPGTAPPSALEADAQPRRGPSSGRGQRGCVARDRCGEERCVRRLGRGVGAAGRGPRGGSGLSGGGGVERSEGLFFFMR